MGSLTIGSAWTLVDDRGWLARDCWSGDRPGDLEVWISGWETGRWVCRPCARIVCPDLADLLFRVDAANLANDREAFEAALRDAGVDRADDIWMDNHERRAAWSFILDEAT